jgi:hypothetical protein
MGVTMMAPLLTTTLVRANRVRSFLVHAAPRVGWEIVERDGERIVRQQWYEDWHRVEHALTRFARAIEELQVQGWRSA